MFREIYLVCVDLILDFQEMTVFKTPKQHKKSAAEGCRHLRLFFRLLCSPPVPRQEMEQHSVRSDVTHTFWIHCVLLRRSVNTPSEHHCAFVNIFVQYVHHEI